MNPEDRFAVLPYFTAGDGDSASDYRQTSQRLFFQQSSRQRQAVSQACGGHGNSARLFREFFTMATKLWDNGGRRQGLERRQYSYAAHIPERRTGKERRSGRDRRTPPRLGPEHRKSK